MKPVTLRTERLVLDLPVLADVDLIAEYCADPVFEHWMTTPWPYTREHALGFVNEYVAVGWQQDREFTWALRPAGSRELLGMVGIRREDDARWTDGQWNLGYWMGGPNRGAGLTTEAARAVVDWGFAEGIAPRYRWEAVAGNLGSLAIARRLGFTFLETTPGRAEGMPAQRSDTWHAELGPDDDRAVKPGWPV